MENWNKREVTCINTREIALVSVFSAIWVTAEIYLGPTIGQITQIHGVPQRLFGWLLMLTLAELTGNFGNVSIMSTVAALSTRIIRRSASLYIWVVGLGYALGGLVFDFLFFLPFFGSLEGKIRKLYVLVVSTVSGVVASVPYILFKFFTLPPEAFIIWIPIYIPDLVIEVVLSTLGAFIGLSILPLIRPWSARIKNKATVTGAQR